MDAEGAEDAMRTAWRPPELHGTTGRCTKWRPAHLDDERARGDWRERPERCDMGEFRPAMGSSTTICTLTQGEDEMLL
ncbi:hypothetical protein Tdes44962_MAKER05176 [Teratosphaeria destructans]|uniref:Uncharacterized protein n=1 Tax=Teratosphaeria destructans TaxID=418781 RepID=A0A9W7SL18_9PEZI|nr:hypothetical protein Tdes44962_MAKER05176 [Teratosphaeria destructans]